MQKGRTIKKCSVMKNWTESVLINGFSNCLQLKEGLLSRKEKRIIHTETKRNFGANSVLSVEVKDKVNRLKAQTNILTLIGYMIDKLRNTTPHVYQMVF